jgi:predicted MFS family arabinose efflux permease
MTALIAANLFFNGTSYAATLPYAGIAAIDGLRFSNADYALLLSASAVVGLVAAVAMGYLSDRVADRRILVLFAALMGALGFGLIYVAPSALSYIVAYCVIVPFGGALFSQSFGYARAYYDVRQPERAEFMTSVLRMVFSASWVLMPPVAGWVAATYRVFDVYGLAAAAYLGSALIFLILLRDPSARIGTAESKASGTAAGGIAPAILIGMGGIVLISVALRLSGTAAPLAIVGEIGGTVADVGLYSGLAALLEIPFTLAWGFAALRWRKHTLIVACGLIYALYMVLFTRAHSVSDVLWLQPINAIAVAGLMSIPISYMQEAIRGRVGLSTSLLDVVFVLASLLSAAIFGFMARGAGYVPMFWVAGALSALGAVVLFLAHRLIGPRVAPAQ